MRVIPRPVRRLVVGSELSAASGRRSEVSEWPRSKFQVSAVRQRRNFGHRNRVIGPYESAAKRISVMGICNKFAGIIAPLVFAALVIRPQDKEVMDLVEAGLLDGPAKEAALDSMIRGVIVPYVVLAALLFAFGILFYKSPVQDINPDSANGSGTTGDDRKSIWEYPYLVLGVLALFCHLGSQQISVSTIIGYAQNIGMDLETAQSCVSTNTTAWAWRNLSLYGGNEGDSTKLIIAYEAPESVKEEMAAEGGPLDQKAIGRDALVFIVNEENPVQSLTQQQLRDIYAGKITNWKEVGGADAAIVAFQRREDSGSQTLFQKLLIQGGELMDAPTELAPTEMGGLVDSIADYNNSANAIGFSVYYYIDQMYSKPGLRLLAVDGVTPSNDTLADGSYPLCNDFYAVIHPDAAADSPERRLYDWLDTDAGQDCIKKSGYVAVGPQTTVTIVD